MLYYSVIIILILIINKDGYAAGCISVPCGGDLDELTSVFQYTKVSPVYSWLDDSGNGIVAKDSSIHLDTWFLMAGTIGSAISVFTGDDISKLKQLILL